MPTELRGSRRRGRGGPRPGFLASVRATLRDPFYRHERRQAGARQAWIGLLVAVLMIPVAYFCCLGWVAVLALPGALVAEGLLYESDRGTIESLLLTPADRHRIVWAKFLARLRPLVWLAAACPFVGASIGALVGMAHEAVIIGLAIGLGVGILAGGMVMGQSLTSGAFGIFSVLVARTRTYSYLLLAGLVFGLYMAESFVAFFVAMAMMAMFMVPMALATGPGSGGVPEWWVVVLAVAVGIALLTGRLILVNILLPKWVLAYSARQMDELLLRD